MDSSLDSTGLDVPGADVPDDVVIAGMPFVAMAPESIVYGFPDDDESSDRPR